MSRGPLSAWSQERGPASAIVSNSATTAHECGILAFTKFKEASFQLKPSEIPFQPLEWPGEPQPRGLRQYNDAWHNSATVPQAVPRKPDNMCHCEPRFAAQPRCSTLAGTGEARRRTVSSQQWGGWHRFRGSARRGPGLYQPSAAFDLLMSFFAKKAATFLQRAGCEKRKWPEQRQRGGGLLSACQEWLYRKPCELLLSWILLNTRGNQEKSDKQKNGATKTARTGWWLVSAGSPLCTSIAGGVPASCSCWFSVALEMRVFVSANIAINAV